MAKNRKENPTLAAHVAEAAGAEREIESTLAAHLLLVSRAQHHARLESHLEASKARVERLERRLEDLGGSARSVARPSKPAKEVKGAAKAAERRATKIATGNTKKVRDAGELRHVLEAARDEQQQALKQSSTYISLRALAKASGDKETGKLAKRLRDEHRDWADFLADELKALSKRLVKAEASERDTAAANRRSATAKRARSRGSGSGGSSSSRSSSRSGGSSSGSRSSSASGRSSGSRAASSRSGGPRAASSRSGGSKPKGSRSGGSGSSASRSGASRSSNSPSGGSSSGSGTSPGGSSRSGGAPASKRS